MVGENISGLALLFVMGTIIGAAYTRGACLTLDLGKMLRYGAIFLVLLTYVGLKMEWKNLACGSVVGLGITAVLALKLCWVKYCLPKQLRKDYLAARRGEEEPGVGYVDGMWVLSYRNGQTMSYDGKGKIARIGFPDGTHWDLSEPLTPSATTGDADGRRVI